MSNLYYKPRMRLFSGTGMGKLDAIFKKIKAIGRTAKARKGGRVRRAKRR